jgi:hypothetical protein
MRAFSVNLPDELCHFRQERNQWWRGLGQLIYCKLGALVRMCGPASHEQSRWRLMADERERITVPFGVRQLGEPLFRA